MRISVARQLLICVVFVLCPSQLDREYRYKQVHVPDYDLFLQTTKPLDPPPLEFPDMQRAMNKGKLPIDCESFWRGSIRCSYMAVAQTFEVYLHFETSGALWGVGMDERGFFNMWGKYKRYPGMGRSVVAGRISV